MTACPDEAQLAAFAQAELSAADTTSIEVHVAGCDGCRRVVSVLLASSRSRQRANAAPNVASLDLQAGASVGRFVILYSVGSGGMGTVYAAYDPRLDRKVAVKVLHALANDELMHEAQLAARLSSPHVVTVFDVGSVGEHVFLATEFFEGGTLAQWLTQSSRGWREVLVRLLEVAEGLAVAHSAGVVHADVKPANVLIASSGRAAIGDFGLARHGSVAKAEPGALVGTPPYLAPELWEGATPTAASDQYAFGVTLHEAVFGVRPFDAPSSEGLRDSVRSGSRRAVSPRRVPRWVSETIERTLQPDPARRFASMSEVVRALRHGLRGPLQGRLLLVAAVVLVGGVAGALAAGAWWSDSRALRACRAGELELEALWSERQRAALEASVVDVEARARARTAFDQWVTRWTGEWREACEATLVTNSQPVSMLAARHACLTDRRYELSALLEELSSRPRGADAVHALGSIGAPQACVASAVRSRRARAPVTPEEREVDARVKKVLARAAALEATGRAGDAVAAVRSLLSDPSLETYPAALAEAELSFGGMATRRSEDQAEAATRLRQAFVLAERLDDSLLQTRAVAQLAQLFALRQESERAQETLEHLDALLSRVTDPYSSAIAESARGQLAMSARRLGAATGHFGRSSELFASIGDEPRARRLRVSQATSLSRRGQAAAAESLLASLGEEIERSLDPDASTLAGVLALRAIAQCQLGESERALELVTRLRALEQTAQVSRRWVLVGLSARLYALEGLERFSEAEATLEELARLVAEQPSVRESVYLAGRRLISAWRRTGRRDPALHAELTKAMSSPATSPDSRAQAAFAVASVDVRSGDLQGAVASLAVAGELTELAEGEELMFELETTSDVQHALGLLEHSDETARRFIDRFTELNGSRPALRPYVLRRAFVALARGDRLAARGFLAQARGLGGHVTLEARLAEARALDDAEARTRALAQTRADALRAGHAALAEHIDRLRAGGLTP